MFPEHHLPHLHVSALERLQTRLQPHAENVHVEVQAQLDEDVDGDGEPGWDALSWLVHDHGLGGLAESAQLVSLVLQQCSHRCRFEVGGEGGFRDQTLKRRSAVPSWKRREGSCADEGGDLV